VTANPAHLPLTAGRVFAERYRLDAALSSMASESHETDSQVGQFWRAYDDVLARPVAILLVPQEHPRVEAVLTQARAAARLAHPSLVRVYDAGEADGYAFVVTEYLADGSLEDRLASGPMEPAAAVELVSQIGSGIAAAHAIGLSHFDASPRTVLFSGAGEARLTGLGSSGVTGGDDSDTPSETDPTGDRADTIALAGLLYAALTSRWPGRPGSSDLAAAPVVDGHIRSPRLVRGGVPRDVDAVVVQALGDVPLRRGLPEIATPAAFVDALTATSGADIPADSYGTDVSAPATVGRGAGLSRRLRRAWIPAGGRARFAAVAVLIVMAAAVIQFARVGPSNYLRFTTPPTAATPSSTPSTTPTATTAAGAQPASITIQGITEFDPYGDHKDPHFAEAKLAVDADPTTAWRTQTYRSAALGNLKPGVGLLIDLGSDQSVGTVSVTLLGTGTSVAVFASDAAAPPTRETAMTEVASQTDAGPDTVLPTTPGSSGRFWLIWLTRLPAVKSGFQGGIADVSFSR
jgi:eukaryotic-like serine/threonine-protein kinase